MSQPLPASAKIRRLALLADTHGQIHEGLLAWLENMDLIVHAGDIGSDSVLDTLARLAPVVAVRGNNDVPEKWAGNAANARALPLDATLDLPGGKLQVVHGHQWPAAASRHRRLRESFPDVRCVAYGHSHRRVIDKEKTPWVVNPGAAGRSRAFGGAGFVEITLGENWSVLARAL
ncbi:MAG: metallophosphoesterase family protein [Pseudomonadota bacterium]